MSIKLNCDMGESFGIWKLGVDEQIMPYVDMANLACGFHAGDAETMSKSVLLASKNSVRIGAHPGYQDLVGFGRRTMQCSSSEIKSIVLYQLGALNAFCKLHNEKISYVKPHGALYNDMMKNENIFKAIVSAIASFDKNIKLMILSTPKNETYKQTALLEEIKVIYEVFADRNYNDDGTLVSRTQANAVIHDETDVRNRIKLLKNEGCIISCTGKKLFMEVDTICVHGDNENALEFVKLLKKDLS